MSKAIILTTKSWDKIYTQIQKDHPPSVTLIRDKMKSVMGFTHREHEEWFDQSVDLKDVRYNTKYRETHIHLDFYNEPKRTMFLLKYGDYIEHK
jgi:hypothetical protein